MKQEDESPRQANKEWRRAKADIKLVAGKDIAIIYNAMRQHVRENEDQFNNGGMAAEEKAVFVQASDLLFRMGVMVNSAWG